MTNHSERDVPIEVTSRHQSVSDRTRALAVDRVQKLLRFHSRISRIQIVLDEEHDEFLSEVIVHVEGGSTFAVKASGDGYRSSIDAVVQKAERQLKKDNEKRRNHKHEPLGTASGAASSAVDDDPEPTYEQAVRDDIEG